MGLKKLEFVGCSLDDLREFPDKTKKDIGRALYKAQEGSRSQEAKP